MPITALGYTTLSMTVTFAPIMQLQNTFFALKCKGEGYVGFLRGIHRGPFPEIIRICQGSLTTVSVSVSVWIEQHVEWSQ